MTNGIDNGVRRVVIAGGGLAAWASAAALAHSLRGTSVEIVVADSGPPPDEPLADHTLPATLGFFAHLGLREAELRRAASGTFRLGSAFADWPRAGEHRLRPFGAIGANIGFIRFHHFLTRRRLAGRPVAAEGFSVNAAAIAAGRVAGAGAPGTLAARLEHGLNLARSGSTELLRRVALASGVRRAGVEISAVERRDRDGFIGALRLADGSLLDGDLFVDATGSDARLLGGALGVPLAEEEALSSAAVAASAVVRSAAEPLLVTSCRALPDGWLLEVPLAGRTVSTLFTAAGSAPAAAARLRELSGLPGDAAVTIAPAAAGRRASAWQGNCVAVGAAAARLEPLVCSELHGLQSDILRLLRLFPPADCPAGLRDEYNAAARREYETARDYLLTLYAAPDLRGEAFWQRAAAGARPGSFDRRRDLFASSGRLVAFEGDVFTPDDWATAWLTAGVEPQGYDPLLARMELGDLDAHFAAMASAIATETSRLPTHAEALAAGAGS